MNKKTAVVYVYLALFAFTLGFSFTMANNAQAEYVCCVVSWCPGEDPTPSIQGHKNPVYPYNCINTGTHACDMYFIC